MCVCVCVCVVWYIDEWRVLNICDKAYAGLSLNSKQNQGHLATASYSHM